MHSPRELGSDGRQTSDELVTIPIIHDDAAASVALGDHMVNRTGKSTRARTTQGMSPSVPVECLPRKMSTVASGFGGRVRKTSVREGWSAEARPPAG